jgi:hypothetical protein
MCSSVSNRISRVCLISKPINYLLRQGLYFITGLINREIVSHQISLQLQHFSVAMRFTGALHTRVTATLHARARYKYMNKRGERISAVSWLKRSSFPASFPTQSFNWKCRRKSRYLNALVGSRHAARGILGISESPFGKYWLKDCGE